MIRKIPKIEFHLRSGWEVEKSTSEKSGSKYGGSKNLLTLSLYTCVVFEKKKIRIFFVLLEYFSEKQTHLESQIVTGVGFWIRTPFLQ